MKHLAVFVSALLLSVLLPTGAAIAQPLEYLVPVPDSAFAAIEAEGSALVTVSFGALDPETTSLDGLIAHAERSRSDFLSGLAFEAAVVTEFETLAAVQLRVTSPDQLAAIAGAPGVSSIAVSRMLYPTSRSSALVAQAGGGPNAPATGTEQMHMLNLKGQGIRIAVLDSGIDTSHPDIGDAVVHERCFMQFVGTCPNGLGRDSGTGSAAEDFSGHGTAVASIITGTGAAGALGIAPASKIESYKVIGPNGAATAEIAVTLDYILANRPAVQVVNMSLGGGSFDSANECNTDYPPLTDAVIALRARGTIVIAASGNGGDANGIAFPACVPSVLSVAATAEASPARASFSDISSFTDVSAPGVDLSAADVSGGADDFSGTSAAAPVVSACAALMIQDGFDTYATLKGRITTSSKSTTGTPHDVPWLNCAPACDGLVTTVNVGLGETASSGRDIILGTQSPETINGFGGNDVICGLDGIDVIKGGNGNDLIFGGGGSDKIYGDAGADTVWAGAGADRVWGGTGSDTMFGGGGQDKMWGEGGNDTLQGNSQSDELHGGNGNDTLRGSTGKDDLFGNDGNDDLYGGDNTDLLNGGPGFDVGHGQRGSDTCLSVEDKTSC